MLRILWVLPVTSHFALCGCPSLCWGYTLIFPLLWPLPALTDCSSSQVPCVCDLPWLHCSGVHASALYSRGGCTGCLSNILVSHNLGVAYSLPQTSSWAPAGIGFVLDILKVPGTRLVISNACWLNIQIQSDWLKMFKSVTLRTLLVGRVKWQCSVWSWCQGRPPGVHSVVSLWCEGWFILICVHCLEKGHSHRALNSWVDVGVPFKTYFLLFSRDEISKILKSSYLRGVNLAIFFAASKIMIFITFIIAVVLNNRITVSQVFLVVMLFETVRFTGTLYFPMAIEKVSEAVVSINRIKVWWKAIFFSCRWTLWTTSYLVSLCASLVTFKSHCQSWQSFQNVIHTPLSSYIAAKLLLSRFSRVQLCATP